MFVAAGMSEDQMQRPTRETEPRLWNCPTLMLHAAMPGAYACAMVLAQLHSWRLLLTSPWWLGLAVGTAVALTWKRTVGATRIAGALGAVLLVALALGAIRFQADDTVRALGLGIAAGLCIGWLVMLWWSWEETRTFLLDEAKLREDLATVKYLSGRKANEGG
jgi:hypothetical protein